MVKYRRINNTRKKAFAGESIVAAGIGAAATLASAAIGASATTSAAKRQALAQQQAAQTQADALKKQNDNANRLQEKQIEFTQKENEQNRDLQNQIQMNLQMLQGQQNENARLDAARIQVKKGGNPFNRAGLSSFLQAGNNMPFEVTDGGYAMPLGITPQGYDLYELRGDNHEQYHKTRGGKYKSGVGIKAATGQVVEGEGGKRNAQGELIMVTPDDIKFISKHSLYGFNPTNAVLNGLDPQVAYNEQELIKAYNNSPVKKNRYDKGGSITNKSNKIDNRTGRPKYKRIIRNVNIKSVNNNNLKGEAKDTNVIGPLSFYPPKYYIKNNKQYVEDPNITYDSWFDEHPEMIEYAKDVVSKYNNRLNNPGTNLPQLNRFYFEQTYNKEGDPIKNEAIDKLLNSMWNGDVRQYKDRRTLNLWEPVEDFPVTTVRAEQFKNGGSGIYIKPENRGKFTALQERTGKSATWFKENGTPAQRKMATFALNARKWNKRKAGGNSVALFDLSNPINFSTDTIAPTVGGIEYVINNREKQKCGGRIKAKNGFGDGGYSWGYDPNKKYLSTTTNPQLDHVGIHNALDATINYDPNKAFNQGLSGGNNTNGSGEKTSKRLSTSAMNYIGAGIDTAGALGGAIITALGNNAAARYSLRGLRDATRATIAGADALKGIDANAYKRSMFTPAHAMVAVRDPYVNLNPQLALAERSAQRRIKQAKLNSLSSAAALNRYANIETGLQDAWSQIYGRGSEISEQIKQANQNSINQIAVKNAEFDNEANREFLRSKLDVLKYNNDIENQAVGIKAGALANQALGIAGIGANRVQANTQSFGNVLQSAGNSFANAMRQNVQNRNNWAMMSSGLTNTQKIDAWANAGNYDMLRDRAAYLQTIADTNKAAREELNYIKSLNIRGIFK